MRALPGRESRTALPESAQDLTRLKVDEEQRRRIRRATGELVAKRGYAGVTLELIVKRAKYSFKTFYKHYANKEEAFVDLFDHAEAATEARINEALAGADPQNWPQQVALAVRAFFDSILADPLIARACLVEGPTAGPAILARYERIATAFVPLLKKGREHGAEGEDLPETIEETLAGAVLWAAYQRLNLSEMDRIPELIPENIELVLRPYIGDGEAARVARETVAAPALS
jgi:AcrR family transcriptional regulator